MPALSKQTLKHRPRARTKPVAKSPSRSAEPFLRFYHSKALRAKTLAVLSSVEQAKDLQHRDELADIVVELTNSGMDYYFLRPLKIANAGFFVPLQGQDLIRDAFHGRSSLQHRCQLS